MLRRWRWRLRPPPPSSLALRFLFLGRLVLTLLRWSISGCTCRLRSDAKCAWISGKKALRSCSNSGSDAYCDLLMQCARCLSPLLPPFSMLMTTVLVMSMWAMAPGTTPASARAIDFGGVVKHEAQSPGLAASCCCCRPDSAAPCGFTALCHRGGTLDGCSQHPAQLREQQEGSVTGQQDMQRPRCRVHTLHGHARADLATVLTRQARRCSKSEPC